MNDRRRGVSLTELLVVMSACSVVMTLTSQLVCRVMQIQIESRANVDLERNTMRLSNAFRSDVHAAKSANIQGADLAKGVLLRLDFADRHQVDYSRQEGTLLRQVSDAGKPVAREEFEFPAACDLTIKKTGTPPRLVLTLSTEQSDQQAVSDKSRAQPPANVASLQVEAMIGRDAKIRRQVANWRGHTMNPHIVTIRKSKGKSAKCRRPGFAVIAALACLLIVVAIVGSMLQAAIRARRELHTERDCRQSELLLSAGAERATGRLTMEPEFRGDVWELPAEAIVGRGAGRVTTKVMPATVEGSWQVQVIAEYPLDRDFPVRRSHTFQVNSATNSSQE